MYIGFGLLVSCISILWVLVEGGLARRNDMLTATQMTHKYPTHPKGLPFIWHFGMWGDLFIITPIIGIIVAIYSGQWSVGQMVLLLAIGMVLSGAMHWVYTLTPFPDSLAWNGGISTAGWLHFLYMGIAFAIIGLLYFCTTNPSSNFLIVVSVVLAAHVAIGNHILLGWINKYQHFAWCPEFLRKPDPWITIAVVCCILAGLTWWASDWHSAARVLFIDVIISIALPFFYFGFKSLTHVPH